MPPNHCCNAVGKYDRAVHHRNVVGLNIPHKLAYKIHVNVRTFFWLLWAWSYKKGGLIA
jgi:hypothetical protein